MFRRGRSGDWQTGGGAFSAAANPQFCLCWSGRRGLVRTTRTCVSSEGKALGFETNVYHHPARQRESDWQPSQAILSDWLISLPKPVGVLACNDAWGRQVLESCRLAGLSVPDQVAVLGVDNDAVFCEMADPPLSSVALESEAAGYEAAELLDGLIRGSVRKSRRVFVRAMGIITRQSTDLVAVSDADVAAALRYIHHEYGNSLSVADVAEAVAMSRRGLETWFSQGSRSDNSRRDSVGSHRTSQADVARDRAFRCASRPS